MTPVKVTFRLQWQFFGPKKESPNTENHRVEWQSLTVTFFWRPSTVTISGEACTALCKNWSWYQTLGSVFTLRWVKNNYHSSNTKIVPPPPPLFMHSQSVRLRRQNPTHRDWQGHRHELRRRLRRMRDMKYAPPHLFSPPQLIYKGGVFMCDVCT